MYLAEHVSSRFFKRNMHATRARMVVVEETEIDSRRGEAWRGSRRGDAGGIGDQVHTWHLLACNCQLSYLSILTDLTSSPIHCRYGQNICNTARYVLEDRPPRILSRSRTLTANRAPPQACLREEALVALHYSQPRFNDCQVKIPCIPSFLPT